MAKRTSNSSINSSIRQQTKSNDEGLAKILAEQKQVTDGFATMKDILTKLNALQAGEVKQKVRLQDLQEKEIKALQRKNELSAVEAKAIAKLAEGMKTFPTLFERIQDKTKGLTNFFKNPMQSMRTGLLKATNIGGINDKRLEREKFITAQKALGVNKSFKEHAADFEKAHDATKAIKKNESKIKELKEATGMSEKQLANTEAGKGLFANRKSLTDTLAQHDMRAAGIKGAEKKPALAASLAPSKSPTAQFADSGKEEEKENEDAKLMAEQTTLLQKIEQNTRGASPDQKAKPAEEGKSGGGLLSGLVGGGKVGNALKGMKEFGIGLLAVAGGLWVASKALASFAEVEWEDIGKGMIALAGFVAIGKVLKNGTGDMIKASVGIVALSGALWVASKAIGEFANLDWESMGKAAVAIVGLGAAGVVLGKVMPDMLMGAVGLVAMGGALWVVTKALEGMAEIGWDTMGKAAVAMAGLGVASLLLGPAAPLMVAAGAGLAVMGAGLWVVGEALQAVGKGFDEMIGGVERLGKIDGGNLLTVAGGLLAVSAAMVAFGGAQALAGLGALVGKLLSFGQDTPLEQLAKIATYGEGIGKAGTGMKDLGEGMKAFSEIKGDTLKDTMKSLKEFPWEQATKFVAAGGSMSTDGAKVYNQSKGNEDKKAENAAASAGGSSSTVIAPSTNVSNTTVQQMRPAIRNQSQPSRSFGGSRYINA